MGFGAHHTLNNKLKLAAKSDASPTASSNQFVLKVADNFHYMDKSEVYEKGRYSSFAAALAEAKSIVDHFLEAEYKSGMAEDDLYAQYTSFGDDPYIVGSGLTGVPFSAWDYAKQRCQQICAPPRSPFTQPAINPTIHETIHLDKNSSRVSIVLAASAFAAHKHRDQRRKGAEASPYINHLIAVANVLANEADITDSAILAAALLHDTIEDTDTTPKELESEFGQEIAAIVIEVTDDKSLPKMERKRLQIEHAAHLSTSAKLVKLADKICNLRDMNQSPPVDWSTERKAEYFTWAKQVVDPMRGASPVLEKLFDEAFIARTHRKSG
jgi:GTP diphosphokinase / guanosine-3',5'-bis(diphosphate) 3'-diphosphatase